jgi:diacylglycerol kinase family enzyme
VISNPVATAVTPRVEDVVLRRLRELVGADLVRTERPLHAGELARRGVEDGADAVVVLAGDGTANEVLNGVGDAVPVGVLPAGGTSVLARSLGLGRSIPDAAGRAAEALVAGRTTRIALGTLNGRRFSFSAGLGFDADVVRRVDARGRRHGRRSGDAYFALQVATLVALARYGRAAMTVEAGGVSERVTSLLAANLHPWSYVRSRALQLAPRAVPAGGLELVGPRRLARRDVPALARYLLVDGAHADGRRRRVLYLHDVREALVRCDRPMPAHVDGDDVGDVVAARLGVDAAGARILV